MSGPAVAAALAFLTEIALLAGAVRAGLALAPGPVAGWSAGLGLAAAIAAVWGLFAAPRAPRRLGWPALGLLKAFLFALGAAAWALANGAAAGLVFAAAAFLGLALGAPDRGAR